MKRDLNLILSFTEENKNSGCLEWTRCLNTDGYPRAIFGTNANGKVHRVVYELYNKRDIKGLVVRHKCDNPKCINPLHLDIGFPKDNIRDMDERQRRGNSKLSHKEVLAIRDLYTSGNYLQKDLAKMFGIDHRTVSSIICFTHFKHVKHMQED